MLPISVCSLQVVFVQFHIPQCGVILLGVKYIVRDELISDGNMVSLVFSWYESRRQLGGRF